MSVYTIGDLHLSFGCDKPMDIFKGWQNYTDKLLENWNRVVSADDTVVIVGDVSWGMSFQQAEKDFRFINDQLNGKKIILKGNHDYWWNTMSKMNQMLKNENLANISFLSNNAYCCDGIVVCGTRGWINETEVPADKKVLLREAGRLELSIKDGMRYSGEMVAFVHYPPIYGAEKNYHILDVLKRYSIRRCYYGHIHGQGASKAFIGQDDGIDFSMVSADFVDFTPQQVVV